MQKIIFVWVQKEIKLEFIETNEKKKVASHIWGLGDIIRGIIKMFQLSKKMNFEFIVDIRHHPVSQFLKIQPHDYETFIDNNIENIPFIFPGEVEKYIFYNQDKDVLYLLTNDFYQDPITEDCRDFIKKILAKNDEFQQFFLEKLCESPFAVEINRNIVSSSGDSVILPKYNILHFRIGDEELLGNDTKNYDEETNIFKYNMEKNDILISDSVHFKNHIKTHFNQFMFDIDMGHIGYEKNLEKIKNTLFEFFVMVHSQKIKSYSNYSWISGFVNIVKEIYNVELKNMKN